MMTHLPLRDISGAVNHAYRPLPPARSRIPPTTLIPSKLEYDDQPAASRTPNARAIPGRNSRHIPQSDRRAAQRGETVSSCVYGRLEHQPARTRRAAFRRAMHLWRNTLETFAYPSFDHHAGRAPHEARAIVAKIIPETTPIGSRFHAYLTTESPTSWNSDDSTDIGSLPTDSLYGNPTREARQRKHATLLQQSLRDERPDPTTSPTGQNARPTRTTSGTNARHTAQVPRATSRPATDTRPVRKNPATAMPPYSPCPGDSGAICHRRENAAEALG